MKSKFDPFLFIGENFICVLYVYDLIFCARDEADIHELDIALHEELIDLEQEYDAAGFLGVNLVHNSETGLLEIQ